jgi:hypothetical protein
MFFLSFLLCFLSFFCSTEDWNQDFILFKEYGSVCYWNFSVFWQSPTLNTISPPGVPGGTSELWVPLVCHLQENPQTFIFKISKNYADKPNSYTTWVKEKITHGENFSF